MADAYIAAGSNIDPEKNIPEGIRLLSETCRLTAASGFYRTRPAGNGDQPGFINGMVRVVTDLDPHDLKRGVLRKIETRLGRVRTADKYAPRTLDLDLCLYGGLVIQTDDLTVPPPDLLTRDFLYVPLLDIDPDIAVPGTGQKLSAIVSASGKKHILEKHIPLTTQIGAYVHGRSHQKNPG